MASALVEQGPPAPRMDPVADEPSLRRPARRFASRPFAGRRIGVAIHLDPRRQSCSKFCRGRCRDRGPLVTYRSTRRTTWSRCCAAGRLAVFGRRDDGRSEQHRANVSGRMMRGRT
jgi:hypothetical protein